MSGPLHIVVSCTDRKRARVPAALRLRAHEGGPAAVRVRAWLAALRAAKVETLPAREMYVGELWKASEALEAAALARFPEATLWVASAGYGLIPADARIKPYGATFAGGSEDSVLRRMPRDATKAAYRKAWWTALSGRAGPARGQPRSLTDLAIQDPSACILVVAGPDYIRAMSDDLLGAARALKQWKRLTVVSNADLAGGVFDRHLVPVDARGRELLGGTFISTHARVGDRLMQGLRRGLPTADRLAAAYAELVEGVTAPEFKKGASMDDDEVRAFIDSQLEAHPGMRPSPMLRKLRDGGHACEQKKFFRLHTEVSEARSRAAVPAIQRGARRTRESSRKLRFFLPDARDMVDPSFDFTTEERSKDRMPGRDDLFVHEVFDRPVLDGMLVSMGIVHGCGNGAAGKYSANQRSRLRREGCSLFFREAKHPRSSMEFMGDCGAFTYVNEEVPPFSVDEVVDFYEKNGFHYGVSLDHIILEFDRQLDHRRLGYREEEDVVRGRQELSLSLAREFLKRSASEGFKPMGAAQGWSPASYARAVSELQTMGYDYIAMGGVVPLASDDIIAVLQAVDEVRKPSTRLHLLGVTRFDRLNHFRALGVASIDSTSPLRRAWKDNKANYFTMQQEYMAIRVPQVGANANLKKRIASGEVDFEKARSLEQRCLKLLARYDAGKAKVEQVLKALSDYQQIHDPKGKDRTAEYRRTLEERPWQSCHCNVCRSIGHHVILFRGAERNRRRGFHNIAVFYEKLSGELKKRPSRPARRRVASQQLGLPPG